MAATTHRGTTVSNVSTISIDAEWKAAGADLGVRVNTNGSRLGPVMSGSVDGFDVSVSPVQGRRYENGVGTRYSVSFDAPHAPEFTLSRRNSHKDPVVHTGNPKFDSTMSVVTDDPVAFGRFLTGSRRALIQRVFDRWPATTITNRDVALLTEDIEGSGETLIDTVCHLIATAEVFARPTVKEVRFDEASVLDHLFNKGLDAAKIAERFELYYQGQTVDWTGEVLTVGALERTGQWCAVLIGSADGQVAESGRVVALALVSTEEALAPGDVVPVTGELKNLDPRKRLFKIG